MPSEIRFFRDSLTLDANLASLLQRANLNPLPGDKLILGARLCKISALPSEFNYVIGADELTIEGEALRVTGVSANKSPNVTILAVNVKGSLNLVCRGMPGAAGAQGAPGDDQEVEIINGRPVVFPATAGQDGRDGGPGSAAGTAIIHFCTAERAPTASAPGGSGGAGGKGGKGGNGRPRGADGKDGRSGASGAPGPSVAAQVAPEQIWTSLDFLSASSWSAYRAEVAAHFFRVFDPASQIIALGQLDAAIQLDSSNLDAGVLRSRIVQRQTPTGLSRDIDISPDYKDLSESLATEAVLVQNAFAAAASALGNLLSAEGFKNQFALVARQLLDRAEEARDNVQLAQQDVQIAVNQQRHLSDQIRTTQRRIDELQNQSFDLGGFLTDVGSIVSSVIAVTSGLGAIVSVPSAIIALNDLHNRFGIVDVLNDEFAYLKDANPKKDFDKHMGEVGKGLTAFMKEQSQVAGLLVNMNTFAKELDGAGSKADQSEAAQLLKQLVELKKQEMIARLRAAQARDRVVAAQRQVQNLVDEARRAQQLVNEWENNQRFLARAVDALIVAARRLVDIVTEDAFLARRALEIYQLERADDLRFDFGYLHPDRDHDATPLERVTESQLGLSALAPSILTWNSLFTRLNVGQIAGFQVVHPAVAVIIDDPRALEQLTSSRGLEFSIDLADTPGSLFELKVNGIEIRLNGASASALSLLWIEHSGHWRMASRTGSTVDLNLFPHLEVFNCDAGPGPLTAQIPAQPQTSTEPGPPFSFWGRGVAADWRLFPDPEATGLDLSRLRSIELTFPCIGLAAVGAGVAPSPLQLRARVAPPRKLVLDAESPAAREISKQVELADAN